MKKRLQRFCVVLVLTPFMGLVAPAWSQSLVHRYSFNDAPGNPTFADSVGGSSWDGSLVGGATLDGSMLVLDGFSGFATLPAGIISTNAKVSIEFWASFSENNPFWTRVFAFGDQNGSGGQRSGLDYTHRAGGDFQNLGFSTGTRNVWANNPGGLNGRTNVHVTVVVDPSGNRMFYYNGTSIASNPGVNNGTVPQLSEINDTFNLIGKSLHDVDALLEGSINEFRIYNGAIDSARVAINDAAGPDRYVADPGPLQSISFTTPANPMVVNQNSQQLLTGNFANVSNVNLIAYGGAVFTTGNSNILSVGTNGIAKGVGVGTTTLVADFGGLRATNTVSVISVPAVLKHRYSFASAANDSVGEAHGTLMGAATIAAGKALLDGSSGTYIDLPGNLINIATNGAVTIDAWVDFGDVPEFSRLFNFGNDGGSSEIYFSPRFFGHGNNHALSQNFPGGRFIEWNGAFRNVSAHLTFVFDPLSGRMAIYRDGVLEYSRYDATAPLSLISTNLAVIGRSLVGADPYMPGAIDEFRIYSGALSPAEIALIHQNGPNSIEHQTGTLNSITVSPVAYPAFSGVVPPVVLANYANLAGFVLQTNNSAVVDGLTVTSSDTNIILVRANNMLRTFRPGTATLTAHYLGKTHSAEVTVQNIATLEHRYSFNADASDAAGDADGVLQGEATVAGGHLVLNGTAGTYVELPPGLLTNYDAVTIDTWVTYNESPSWIRLWYFGDDRANEFYFSPSFAGGSIHSLQTGFPINGGARDVAPRLENQTVHVTSVYGNGFIGIYTNGVLESASSSNQGRMDQIGTSFSWIGRSPYADPFMNCTVNEFRIYKGRLSPEEILASDVLGPDQLLSEMAVLRVTQTDGSITLRWGVAAAGFAVQSRPSLGSGEWETLNQAPVLTGDNWTMTIPSSDQQRYFRLWK